MLSTNYLLLWHLLQSGSTEATEKGATPSGQYQVICHSQCKSIQFRDLLIALILFFLSPTLLPHHLVLPLNLLHISLQADFLVRSHSVIKSKRKHIRGSHLMDEDMVSYDCRYWGVVIRSVIHYHINVATWLLQFGE